MPKKPAKLKSIITAADVIAVIIIAIGVYLGLMFDDASLMLIFFSISILTVVFLIKSITDRYNDYVEARDTSHVEEEKYKMSVRKDAQATHTIIENYNQEETDKSKKNKEVTSEQKNNIDKKEDSPNIANEDITDIPEKKDEGIVASKISSKANKPENTKMENNESNITDDEGFRIIRKKPSTEAKEATSEETQEKSSTASDDIENKSKVAKPEETPINKEAVDKDEPEVPSKDMNIDDLINISFEDAPTFTNEPRKEFEYTMEKIISALKTTINANTAGFILVNSESNDMIFEAIKSDKKKNITKQHRTKIDNDIISQIIVGKKPQLLSEINSSAELDLLPYYSQISGVKSFIGVPIFYDNTIIGVLIADSLEKNRYDSNSVGTFANYTRLISAIVRSYMDKYELLQNSKTLEAIERFYSISSSDKFDFEKIGQTVVSAISELFEFQLTGIIGYSEDYGVWKIMAVNNQELASRILGQPIDLENTMVGKSIIEMQTIVNTPVMDYKPRISRDERAVKGGYFISVPLRSQSNVYGAIFVEGDNPSGISQIDVAILETLGFHAGESLEKAHYLDILQKSSLINSETGLLNNVAFFRRLHEETTRAKDFQSSLVLAVMQIDKYASYQENQYGERKKVVENHVLNIINQQLRSYDIIGNIDNDNYGIILIGSGIEQSKLWAERVRNEIAISNIQIEGREFSVTVSFGLAPSTAEYDEARIKDNAMKALSISLEKTNSVQIYS